jgi:S1-C subfamily serine protease
MVAGMARSYIVSALLCLWVLPAHAALPDTVDKIRPSIVAVGTVKPAKRANAAGPALNYLGTGFVVGNGRQVITNFHVIPQKLDVDAMEALAVFVGRGGSGEARQAHVVRTDPDHDVALLEIGGTVLPALQLAENGTVREGEEIAFTGYPIGPVLGLYPATHRGIVAAITPIVIPAMSSRTLTADQIRRIRSPFDVYQLDAVAYPGNSGSPVYDARTGHVIGVINSVLVKKTKEAALTDPSGITYAIPVRYVRALLAGAG